jgi:hypothetical protein
VDFPLGILRPHSLRSTSSLQSLFELHISQFQRITAWSAIGLAAERFAGQVIVCGTLCEVGMQFSAQRPWFDSEQVQIAQGVDIGSQEQPVFGMVVLFALIWLDVSRFQHGENLAPSDQTPITVAAS